MTGTTNPEFWWPSADSLEELTVEETPEGLTLSAPEGSECAKWLEHWNQTEELHQFFNECFEEALSTYLNKLESNNGETEIQCD